MASSAMATMAVALPHSLSHIDGLRRNRDASVIRLPHSRRRRCSSVFTVSAEGGINPDVRKNEDKVVDSVVVSELAKPLTAYCRCWRSGTFPLCDGSHVKHNKATGDNVGPLLVKK